MSQIDTAVYNLNTLACSLNNVEEPIYATKRNSNGLVRLIKRVDGAAVSAWYKEKELISWVNGYTACMRDFASNLTVGK